MNFEKNLKYYQKIVDKNLRNFFNSLKFPESKNLLMREQLKVLRNFCLSLGKRLRPIMAIMAFKGISKRDESEIFFSVLALELYHNYTLIHDDIYDEDIIRRGKPTNHFLLKKWFEKRYKGNASRFGTVAGFINGKILRSMANLPILQSNISPEKKLQILNSFYNLDILDNTGQAIDLFFEKEEEITEKDYFKMVNYKTGGLFKTSMETGAILANASDGQKKVLKNYAENLAYVFQIKDDLLDLSIGGEKGRGKGSDIRQGKKTLLLIMALKRASQSQKKMILKIVGNQQATKKEIGDIIGLYHKLEAIDYCQKIANQKIKKALFWLNRISPKLNLDSQNFFEDLTYFMFQRKK